MIRIKREKLDSWIMFGDDLDSIPEPAVQSVANSAGGGGGTETTTAVAVATTTTTTQSHRLFLRTIPIATTVSDTQFTAYLVAAFLSIAMFVFLNASQAFVLGQIVQIPSNGLGDASGSLTFYDELCSLVLVFCWGVLSDVWGRGVVYSAGFLWMGVGLALFTYAWNLYPSLLLFRIVFAVGGSAASAMLTAVLSDYAVDQGRGRVSALVGMASGSGALLALFGFLRIPVFWGDDEVMGLRWTYWIVAGISFGVAFLMAGTMINWGKIMGVLHSQQQPPASSSPLGFDDDFVVVHTDHNSNNNINVSSSPAAAVGGSSSSHPAGTCPALKLSSTSKTSSASSSNSSLDSQVSASAPLVPHHSSSTSASVATPTARPPSLQNCPAYKKSKSFTPILIDGLLAIRDPRVLLGYIGGFLARGDTIIITLFLPLWVYKFYIDKGLCEGGGGHHVPDIKLKCHEAYILASKLR